MKLTEIKELLHASVSQEILSELESDPRIGVQKLLQQYQKRQAKMIRQKSAFLQRFSFEKRFWSKHQLVAGIDEVGRGPLAGPVVTAAVILPTDFDLIQVNDSKQLTPKNRRALYPKILEEAVDVGIGLKSAQVIDQVNIYQADRLAMAQAVEALSIKPDVLLVDAMQVPIDLPQVKLIHGDARSNSIAAASIVAKVFRDDLMTAYGELYPEYDFAHNAGYGTPKHLAALKEFGPTPIHRKTFAPVDQMS